MSLAADPQVFDKIYNDIISGFNEPVHPELFEMYRDNYHKAINSVFGTPKNADPYYEMTERFKLNTSRLAAYKSHYATNSLKTLYREAPQDFTVNNTAVLKTFNRWQATEYNTATARCRSAKQFKQFAKEKDLYPNLEWLATRSSTPRELHTGFVGTVLPQDDPFWQENQPGNLYNCKCDWRSTDSNITKHPEGSVPPSPGLEGNPATTGEVFSDKHPYYKKTDEHKLIDRYVTKTVIGPTVKKIVADIEPFTGKRINSENLQTGYMVVTRRSIKEIVNHNANFKVQTEGLFVEFSPNKWDYIGYALSGTNHPEAAYFLYYKTNVDGAERFVNMIVHKHLQAEMPYAITDKVDIEKIISGLPADIDKYIKK